MSSAAECECNSEVHLRLSVVTFTSTSHWHWHWHWGPTVPSANRSICEYPHPLLLRSLCCLPNSCIVPAAREDEDEDAPSPSRRGSRASLSLGGCDQTEDSAARCLFGDDAALDADRSRTFFVHSLRSRIQPSCIQPSRVQPSRVLAFKRKIVVVSRPQAGTPKRARTAYVRI